VVLVATPEAPVTAEHVARAVADTGAPDVALLPGGVVAADALVDHPGPVVEVLDADDELRATVAALAFATSSTAVGLHAAVRALGRLRAVRVEHADALPAGLAEVLHDAHGESLTVLHREPLDAAAAAHLDAALTGADAEHVLVGPTGSGPAFFLGLD
ncbi:aldehyde dehydrogenase, partial [Cellulomonas biazotea]